MTVVRLPDDELWVHSPIPLTDALFGEVASLGRVSHLVAPNRFHHLSVSSWRDAFPEAVVHVAPDLLDKRPDLAAAKVLDEASRASWSGGLEQVVVQGMPLINEVVFFHASSTTLIATDLAFNIGSTSPPLTRAVFRFIGSYGRLSPSFVERVLVRDRAAFRKSLEQILSWPFERVIVAHGGVSETGGRSELERGYAWVLEK